MKALLLTALILTSTSVLSAAKNISVNNIEYTKSSESKIDAAYAEYQVPDDLNW